MKRDELIGEITVSEPFVNNSESLRWQQFKSPDTTPFEWANHFLDSDAISNQHNFVNAAIAETICKIDGVDAETSELLFAVALVDGFGRNDGIIQNYDKKTKSQSLKEILNLESLLKDGVVPSLQGEIGEDIFEVLVDAQRDRPDLITGQLFNLVKRVSYVRTAIIAHEASTTLIGDVYGSTDNNPDQYYRLLWLANSVLGNHLPNLIENSNRKSVSTFLEANIQELSTVLDALIRDDVQKRVSNYNRREGLDDAAQMRKLISARQAWQEFVDTSNHETYFMSPERFVPELDRLVEIVNAHRRLGKRIVLTSGTFDIAHVGHARYLQRAKESGDIVIVGVDSDAKVKQRKGPNRPIVGELERAEIIQHFRWVDIVTIKPPDRPRWELIKSIMPDTLITTEETYSPSDIAALSKYCKEVRVLPPQATTSTTARIRQMQTKAGKTVIAQQLESDKAGE